MLNIVQTAFSDLTNADRDLATKDHVLDTAIETTTQAFAAFDSARNQQAAAQTDDDAAVANYNDKVDTLIVALQKSKLDRTQPAV